MREDKPIANLILESISPVGDDPVVGLPLAAA